MPDASEAAGLRLFHARSAAVTLAVLLGLYTLSFLLFYPRGITVADEGAYVRQAQMLLDGSNAVALENPFTGEVEERPVSQYPLGTALLLLPFVALGGREAAVLASLVCTLAAVALTGRWLHEQGRSPLWAALLLAYPPTIVLSRLAMSEAASLFLVSLGLWLLWRGLSRGGAWLFGSGLVAGASFAFREANVLLFAPLFLGCVVRRDRGWPWLVVGGVLGLGLRLGSAWIFYGDPFFTKRADAFGFTSIGANAPLYLFCLLVLVPGGLIATIAYRGERRQEVVATILLFVAFHLLYAYSADTSGLAKRLVLGPRYFVPLLPLLALAAADVWPRVGARLRAASRAPRRLERTAGGLVVAVLVMLSLGMVSVHWAHAAWARDQVRVRSAILEHTRDGEILVTNWRATGKFIDLLEDDRVVVPSASLRPEHVELLIREHGSVALVLLDRSDSEFWRRNAFDNDLLQKRIRAPKQMLFDQQITPTDRLRIWRVGGGVGG